MMMTNRRFFLRAAGVFGLNATALLSQTAKPGILLMAHGGSQSWNDGVNAIAASVDKTIPVELAFGMATRQALQNAANKLKERGVTEIIAVPLFVSSHSSVITSTEYLLGLRKEMPKDLKLFATMSHGPAGHGDHSAHGAPSDGTKPIELSLPIRMTPALNSHRIVADILIDRANSISDNPVEEVAILVAHGPNPEDDNRKWLADMKVLAERMQRKTKFTRVDYLTVRDDAPEPIASQAKAEFRALVSKAAAEKKKAVVVPLLMSFGGVEGRMKKRLEGLDYVMAKQGLLPDPRIAEWILESANTAK